MAVSSFPSIRVGPAAKAGVSLKTDNVSSAGPIVARKPAFVLWARAREQQEQASEGSGMHIDPKEGHPAMDYAEHEKTYKLFCKLTAWTIIGVVIVMAALAIFVA